MHGCRHQQTTTPHALTPLLLELTACIQVRMWGQQQQGGKIIDDLPMGMHPQGRHPQQHLCARLRYNCTTSLIAPIPLSLTSAASVGCMHVPLPERASRMPPALLRPQLAVIAWQAAGAACLHGVCVRIIISGKRNATCCLLQPCSL